MTAIIPLFELMGIDVSELLKQEIVMLEAALFIRICEGLTEVFREQQKDYFRLIHLTTKMENSMLDAGFASFIIKDILSTKKYTLRGIAQYTDFHEDVIVDTVTGKNIYPSSIFLRRIIELHYSVRVETYHEILKKVFAKFFR